MLGDALSFPRQSDDWLPTLLIGGVLSILGFLIVPIFIVQGYYVRVLRAVARGDDTVPSFTDWGDLIVDGVKLFVIILVYGLLLVVPVLVILTVAGVGGYAAGGGVGAALAGGVAIIGGLVVLALALVVAYITPAAAANFAVEGRFGAAFDFSTVFGAAFTSDYAMAWLLALVVGIVGGLVGGALTFLIVGIFVLFYVQVSTFYLFGRGFAEGRR
jgi:hypothetical protein